MPVTPIRDFISSVLARQSVATPRVTSTAPTSSLTQPTQGDSSVVPQSGSSQSSNYYTASVSIAQLSSFLEVAQSGTEGIASILQNLQSLAEQAQNSSPADPDALNELNSEFQQALSGINSTVEVSTFGGTQLLGGAFSAPGSAGQNPALSTLSLPNLTTSGLFGSTQPSLSTPSNAANALTLVNNALSQVNDTSNNIAQVQNQTGFAAASIETALNNTVASASVLTEADLAGDMSDVLSGLLSNPTASSKTQTANLSPALMSLIQE